MQITTPIKRRFYWLLMAFLFVTGLVILKYTYNPNDKYANYSPYMQPALVPSKYLRYMTLGYSDIYAQILWIRVLQNMDYCSTKSEKDKDRHNKPCLNSWVFHMFDNITELLDRIPQVYSMGGTTLSVLVNDAAGAKVIYDKGIKKHPTYWPLAFKAGYHYMAELKNEKQAAKYLIQAADNGAPKWVYNLAARLLTPEGQAILKLSALTDYSKKLKDPRYRKQVEKKIQTAKNVLNKNMSSEQKKTLQKRQKNRHIRRKGDTGY